MAYGEGEKFGWGIYTRLVVQKGGRAPSFVIVASAYVATIYPILPPVGYGMDLKMGLKRAGYTLLLPLRSCPSIALRCLQVRRTTSYDVPGVMSANSVR